MDVPPAGQFQFEHTRVAPVEDHALDVNAFLVFHCVFASVLYISPICGNLFVLITESLDTFYCGHFIRVFGITGHHETERRTVIHEFIWTHAEAATQNYDLAVRTLIRIIFLGKRLVQQPGHEFDVQVMTVLVRTDHGLASCQRSEHTGFNLR